jgi:hypothetical protein
MSGRIVQGLPEAGAMTRRAVFAAEPVSARAVRVFVKDYLARWRMGGWFDVD